jgi:hypothetical protein
MEESDILEDIRLAIIRNDIKTIKEKVNERNIDSIIDIKTGNSSLHLTIIYSVEEKGREEIFYHLIQFSPNLYLCNKLGQSIFQLALSYQFKSLFEYLDSQRIILIKINQILSTIISNMEEKNKEIMLFLNDSKNMDKQIRETLCNIKIKEIDKMRISEDEKNNLKKKIEALAFSPLNRKYKRTTVQYSEESNSNLKHSSYSASNQYSANNRNYIYETPKSFVQFNQLNQLNELNQLNQLNELNQNNMMRPKNLNIYTYPSPGPGPDPDPSLLVLQNLTKSAFEKIPMNQHSNQNFHLVSQHKFGTALDSTNFLTHNETLESKNGIIPIIGKNITDENSDDVQSELNDSQKKSPKKIRYKKS